MTEYHDRTLDDPHPPAEDRPVAGWPGHEENRPADGHADDHTDERAGETIHDDEPLTGEVVNDEPAGEHESGAGWGGRHERTEETAEDRAAAGEHVGEPFGTEEPMVVAEPDGTDADTDAVGTTDEGTTDEATAAEPVAADARPGDANDLTVDRFLEPDAAERFRDRWREVKAVFVDDPADAVRQASTLSGEAVDELTAALGRLRQELDGAWDEGRESDTERLRVALRGYGSLIDRILTR